MATRGRIKLEEGSERGKAIGGRLEVPRPVRGILRQFRQQTAVDRRIGLTGCAVKEAQVLGQ